MFAILKKIWGVIKGRNKIMFVPKEEKLKKVEDFDDFELINSYQAISSHQHIYLQELMQRKISKRFVVFPKDIKDELNLCRTDINHFIAESVEREDYEKAHEFEIYKKRIKNLIIRMEEDKKYIMQIK